MKYTHVDCVFNSSGAKGVPISPSATGLPSANAMSS